MKTVLYVFSATGNCLPTAQKLAAHLEDCEIIPAAAASRQRKVKETAESVAGY